MKIVRFTNPADFLCRAERWLLQREAEHNLVLGLASDLARGPDPRYQPPIYFAAVERDGEVVGCAFRTPPFKLGLTRMPLDAVPALARDVAQVYQDIPAIMGPERESLEVAKAWTAIRGNGSTFSMGPRHRIHQIDSVIMPPAPPPGRLRLATPADMDLVLEWSAAFYRDTGQTEHQQGSTARRLIGQGLLHLWDDGEPRSMAAAFAPTPNGIRVAYVYTPPALRGRGYASATVGTLSRMQLQQGRRFCFLYTDLANPVSNAIYARLGYRPVADVVDVVIDVRRKT